METKKFIAGLFTDKKIANFVENQNLMDFAIFGIKPETDGKTEFQTLSNFWKLETHNLDTNGQFLFELFGMFRNPKNAIASLLKHAETKKPITEKTFTDQAKLTPKTFTEEQKKMRLFSTFYNSLTEADQTLLGELAQQHFYNVGIDQTGFEFFFINGTNGIELKQGQFIRLKDPLYGFSVMTMVLQASPEGYVSLIDSSGILTLSNESARLMKVVDEVEVPKEAKKAIQEIFDTQKINSETDKITNLEVGAKLWEKSQLEKAKAEKKADEDKKKLEASTTEKAQFDKMSLTSLDEVKDFVKKLNTAKLIPAHKQELTEKVAKVKETLKTKVDEVANSTTPENGKETTSKRRRNAKPEQTGATIITPPDAIEPITETKPKATKKITAKAETAIQK